MPTRPDPMESLRALARQQRADVPAARELKARLLSRPTAPSASAVESWRWRRRRRYLIGAAAMTVATGAGAAAAYLSSRQPERPEVGVACWAEYQGNDHTWVIGGTTEDPVEACAQVWADGKLPNIDEPLPAGQSVPPLVACTGDLPGVNVFVDPGGGCESLGQSDAAPLDETSVRIVELQDRLVEEINLAGCLGLDAATDVVLAVLDDLALDGWTIVPRRDLRDSDCIFAEVESTTKTVHLGTL